MLKEELLENIKRKALDDVRLLPLVTSAKAKEIKQALRELSDLGLIRLKGKFSIEGFDSM